MTSLRPFWRYYGGKWRAAPHYPKPVYNAIVEPFAGAAGYSLRYPERAITLVERCPKICEIWRWLIGVTPAEVLRIPEVEDTHDLPGWVPQGARWLVGFSMNAAASTPRRTLSAGRRKLRAMHRQYEGWSPAMRDRVAYQVEYIRHWKIVEGDYTRAPDIRATWFVDPPYNNSAGRHYPYHKLDYHYLGEWCAERYGQTLVCENAGARWLPFESFMTFRSGIGTLGSREVLWQNDL